MTAEIERTFVLRRHEERRVRPRAFGGAVVLTVRCATQSELQVLEAPETSAAVVTEPEEAARILGPHIVGLEGMVDEQGQPVRTLADLIAQGVPWALGELLGAVIRASILSDVEVGKSLPQSSGAASTKPGTAAPAGEIA